MQPHRSPTSRQRGRCSSNAPEMPPHPPDAAPIATQRHDDGMKQTMENLLRLPGEVHLPMRMGGLGIRSAQRMAPGAYWASWADALHMIDQRLPTVADRVVKTLNAEGCLESCTTQRGCLTGTVSWADPIGTASGWESDRRVTSMQNLGSGRMAGNTTLLLLPNTTSGRT